MDQYTPLITILAPTLAALAAVIVMSQALLKGWQDARQKAREEARAALCSPKPDLSTFMGRLDWRGKRLETQLATYKAERPKLEAFYASLDDRQKAAWDETRARAEERRASRRR